MSGARSGEDSGALPDPATEIQITALHSTRGINFWARCPVTRMDMRVGAYEHISSADVSSFTDALTSILPGLVEHQCSIGERGGFVTRLRQGTYAPHIVEHVALELQMMVGHDVAFGRTRGTGTPGEYTVVFSHVHEQVGLRAAALALEVVLGVFAGKPLPVDPAITELAALATTPDAPDITGRVACGITGGFHRASAQAELIRRMAQGQSIAATDTLCDGDSVIVDVSPAFLLQAGLPYAHSTTAIVLDCSPVGIPERFQDPDRARKLASIMADAVPRGGLLVCPAGEHELHEYALSRGVRTGVFAVDASIPHSASASATLRGDRIYIEYDGESLDGGTIRPDTHPAPQLAAALAAVALREACAETRAANVTR